MSNKPSLYCHCPVCKATGNKEMIDTRSCEYCEKLECSCKEEISSRYLRRRYKDRKEQRSKSDNKARRSSSRASACR